MLRRAALLRTDVSEEFSASIIKATRIGELGTLAVTISQILVTLMMDAPSLSQTPLLKRAARRNIPEEGILHILRVFAEFGGRSFSYSEVRQY
jgi:hypothetical protein